MKKINQLISLSLATVLVCGISTSALAAVTPVAAEQPALIQTTTMPAYLSGNAKITAIEGTQITVKTTAADGTTAMDLVLNTGDTTVYLNNENGIATDFAGLKVGDSIYAYYSAAMTRSIPPQAAAIAIVTNLQADQPIARYHAVEQVTKNTDGSVTVLTDGGSLFLTIGKDTPLTPYKTKNIVTVNDIKVGTPIMAWYNAVAMSMPAQAHATKAVILPTSEKPAVPCTTLHVNGIALNAPIYQKNDCNMVPLRAVAEALGFKLIWNAADQSAAIDNGTVKTTVTIGQDLYYMASSSAIGLTQAKPLGAAAYLANDTTTYVPATIFSLLLGEKAVVVDGALLNINSK